MQQSEPSPTGEHLLAAPAAVAAGPGFRALRAIVESAVIAVVGSAGLYLVGFVYADAYYGRMSIDLASLDFPTPYIALQSVHTSDILFNYPLFLLVLSFGYRALITPKSRVGAFFARLARRLGRYLPLAVNIAAILPLLTLGTIGVRLDEEVQTSVFGDVTSVFEASSTILLIYAVWRSLRAGSVILDELRRRQLLPSVLLFVVYLLSALVDTATVARVQAESVMMGVSDSSIEIRFDWKDGAPLDMPSSDLILVVARNDKFYVVERQGYPPAGRPTAYVVPDLSIEAAQTRRANEAPIATEGSPVGDGGVEITVGEEGNESTPTP